MVVVGVILAAPLAAGRAGSQNPPPPGRFKVIGYYPDWTAGRYPLAGIPAAKLTHVMYAFARVGADYKLAIIRSDAAVSQVYPGDCLEPGCKHGLFNQITLLKQKHPHLKFILSVGGWADPQSVRLKGEYIVSQGLAGGMFWELSNDNGDLLDALRAGLGMR
jgi:GH18 family chitinase